MRKPQQNLIEFAIQNTLDEKMAIECQKRKLESENYTNYNANLNDPLVIVFTGFVKAGKGYEYSYTNFPFYRLVYTASGQATLKYPGKSYVMKSGTICGLPPKDTGTIIAETDVPWGHFFLHFTGKEAAKVFQQTRLNTKKILHPADPSNILQYFDDILEEERHDREFSHIISVHYLRILLLTLSRDIYGAWEDHSLTSRETYLFCRNYINRCFSEIISFQDLADQCNISKVYFCRLFKQYADTTPMAYVMNLKMNKAAILLMQTDQSIKQISQSLAFEDQCYFSKLFKKHYGISPKSYRKRDG